MVEPDNWGHVPNPDGKVAPKKMFMVKGRHKYNDGRKPSNHCMTLDTQDGAVRLWKNWRGSCGDDKVEIFVAEVEWTPYEPTSKAIVADMQRVEKKASGE